MRIVRENFTEATKKAARERAKGRCEDCGGPTGPGNGPEVDHITECWEGGDNSLENAIVLGKKCCHEAKTAAATARRAKADRQRAQYLGTKRPSYNPIPGSRSTPWKRKMNGETVRR